MSDWTVVGRFTTLTLALAFAAAAFGQSSDSKLSAFLDRVGLSSEQRDALEAGRPVAKVLSWGDASEIYVFGAVHIDGAPAAYLKSARNVSRLAGTPGYLAIGELPANPAPADLAALTLDPDDIKALKSCKEGDCDVQLPSAAIQAFHDAIDWSQPDPTAQVNTLARARILDLIREYQRGGNEALGIYRDKKHPARVAEQFATMVSRAAAVPDVIPALRQFLLQYPRADLPDADSFVYWEKIDFGMKPTIRVNHAVLYQPKDRPGLAAVAIKQLYASHYFHTALDVSVCIADSMPGGRGFHLVTLKGSEQAGLTGVKGSIVRRTVVDRTRSSLEKALAAVKERIERSQAPDGGK
jgi:hypothetical protein